MFKRFKKSKSSQSDNPSFVVRDSFTHAVIAKGTKEVCAAFITSFGLCYMEVAQ